MSRKDRFSLTNFLGELHRDDRQGLYKPNLYMVEFENFGPQFWALGSIWQEFMKDTVFWANSANLPGIQIITSDHRRQGFGPFDRRPFGAMMTDIPITFMLDNRGKMLGFFNNWMNNIINYNAKGGEHHKQTASGADSYLFEMRYPETYKCGIKISTLDHRAEYIITYHLREAFPMQMGDISIAWAETDQFTSLPVQFTFRTYDTDYQPMPDSADYNTEKLIRAGTIPTQINPNRIHDKKPEARFPGNFPI